ncbi:MAG: hypothetical protein BWY49_00661 [Candidatus Omnitrophica bacterium ADurb.Bin314]|nr:MAG: hypothetical protein BWY49_00661 [Candidatus Omnitrophica bacterium ADurb.Bin314]
MKKFFEQQIFPQQRHVPAFAFGPGGRDNDLLRKFPDLLLQRLTLKLGHEDQLLDMKAKVRINGKRKIVRQSVHHAFKDKPGFIDRKGSGLR